MSERCPTCGSPVRVHTGGEGTSSYEPMVGLSAEYDALAAELVSVRAERDEWKAEAERSKWPKEAAQEYHALKAENSQLRDALERARADLREIVYLQDGEPGERVVLTGRGVTTIAREGIRAAAAVSEETP